MDDYSWIAPGVKNLADAFGMNPKLAAEGRKMQAEQAYLAARTANTESDTALNPFRQRVYESEAERNNALAGKTGSEKAGIEFANKARQSLYNLLESGALQVNSDGSYTISPNFASRIAAGLSTMGNDPEAITKSLYNLTGMTTVNPRIRNQVFNTTGSTNASAAFTDEQAAKIRSEQTAAEADLQRIKNTGSATNAGIRAQAAVDAARIRAAADGSGSSGTPGMTTMGVPNPKASDLNTLTGMVNEGAAWAQKVPLVGGDAYFNESQAMRVAQAARNAYPTLPIQDAIVKFVAENKGIFGRNYELFGNNQVDIIGELPVPVVPTTPAAPTAAATPSAAGLIGLTPEQAALLRGEGLGPTYTPSSAAGLFAPVTPVPSVAPSAALAPAGAAPVRITADEAGRATYDRLPPGTVFIDPNGQTRIK